MQERSFRLQDVEETVCFFPKKKKERNKELRGRWDLYSRRRIQISFWNVTVLANTILVIRRRNSSAAEADFVIPWKVSRSKRQSTDGEFVTKYIVGIVSVLDLRKFKFQVYKISNSGSCTSEMSDSTETTLRNDFKNCLAVSLAFVGPQLLMVFAVDRILRHVSVDIIAKEECWT